MYWLFRPIHTICIIMPIVDEEECNKFLNELVNTEVKQQELGRGCREKVRRTLSSSSDEELLANLEVK